MSVSCQAARGSSQLSLFVLVGRNQRLGPRAASATTCTWTCSPIFASSTAPSATTPPFPLGALEERPPPAFRVLTWRSRSPFLCNRHLVPPSLTHLYWWSFDIGELFAVVPFLGAQLVSLRLEDCKSAYSGFMPWSLLDVMSEFPNLRFFQADLFDVRPTIFLCALL